jgi:Fe-S cluster assembly iron-binding protein IscA
VEITERPQTVLVSLTESAAEKIRQLQAEVLRLAVQGGGC